MIVCFVLGLGLAIGHHFYYYSLDNTAVGDQDEQAWRLRIGTGMAFLAKTFLTTAVGFALVQNFWWTLRLKPVRLSTLDSMWDIRGSIFNFFDPHIWIRGPNVAILGLITWTIPLVTVVTPATLSVQSTLISRVAPQQLLPYFDWNFFKYTTMSESGVGEPTPTITRFITGAVIQGSVYDLTPPAPNSSYTYSFIGPYIQCEQGREAVNASFENWYRRSSMFQMTWTGFVAKTGNISRDLDVLYDSDVSWRNPIDTEPLAEDLVGKLILALHPYAPYRTIVECAMYNASITVDFGFVNGQQSQNITELTVLNRVFAYREKQAPTPPDEHERFSYTAIMDLFNKMFVGRCWYNPERCTDTQVMSSALAESKEMYGMLYGDNVQNQTAKMPGLIEAAAQLGKNITLSLLTDPFFHQNMSSAPQTNVTIFTLEPRYLYTAKNLLIAYGVSVFVSLLCIIAGLLSMWYNGFAFADTLSTILRATRNKKFDEIVDRESTTGADPGPKALGDTRVVWVGLPASDSGEGGRQVSGLKPLPSLAETEKGTSTGNDKSTHPMSPITFSNRIRERKSYRPAVERVESNSNEDVSNSNSTSNLTGFSREGFF
ncbi:uncharacterized protein BDV14DRAFT_104244 [Aspergillus stella-maris]|uniref:uncharacterized protein n=1 Tax=Aspergillus stella-maris TaxID=1810926 RepID=UPI003CCCCBD1